MISEKQYKKLLDMSVERSNKYSDWIRNLILISASIIGLLVSLKLNHPKTEQEYITFVIAIIGLGVGILAGSISLYAEILLLDKTRRIYADSLIEIMQNNSKELPLGFICKSIFSRIVGVICLSSFFVSIVSLVIYGILKG